MSATPAARPGAAGLPDGFVVELNRKVGPGDDGRALIGGSPTRVLYLTETARALFVGRRITVTDGSSRAFADRLLENGMADPVLAALPAGDGSAITIVIPVKDRAEELDRLLASVGAEHPRVVVDDGSADGTALRAVAGRYGATYLRLAVNVGPAGARNAGLAVVATEFVAFVDSDVVLQDGALETMLKHFADPRVAMVAPRVKGLPSPTSDNWIGRYEDARSSLDLGSHPASVRPRSPVSWVSSTCLLARVASIGDGFSAEMRVGEDVDMVWRLSAAGWRIRYEPAAEVWHEHRVELRSWLARKAFYGTGGHALASRHGYNAAPAVLAPWSAGVIIAVLAQRRWSLPVVALLSLITVVQISRKLSKSEHPLRVSAGLTANGVVASLSQAMELLLRHWWPLALVGALVSRRMRRAILVSAVLDVALEYRRTGAQIDPVRFGVARRLDDLAYGAGLWAGAIRGRSWLALMPDVRRNRSDV